MNRSVVFSIIGSHLSSETWKSFRTLSKLGTLFLKKVVIDQLGLGVFQISAERTEAALLVLKSCGQTLAGSNVGQLLKNGSSGRPVVWLSFYSTENFHKRDPGWIDRGLHSPAVLLLRGTRGLRQELGCQFLWRRPIRSIQLNRNIHLTGIPVDQRADGFPFKLPVSATQGRNGERGYPPFLVLAE